MVGVTIEVKSEAVLARLKKLTQPQLATALESIGQLFVARAKDNIAARSGPDGPWPRSALTDLYGGARTWTRIRQSLHANVSSDGKTLTVGATHVAALVRQRGTVGAGGTEPDIKPVKKKMLTIPLSDAASKASFDGKDARTAFPDGFILKEGHGASALNHMVIARKIGGRTNKAGQKTGQKLELLYLLVPTARIRPHAFLPVSRDGTIKPASLWDEAKDVVAAAAKA